MSIRRIKLTGENKIEGVVRDSLLYLGALLAFLLPEVIDTPNWSILVGDVMMIYSLVAGAIAKEGDLAEIILSIGKKLLTVLSIIVVTFAEAVTPDEWNKVADVILQIMTIITSFIPMIVSYTGKGKKDRIRELETENEKLKNAA